MPLWGDVSDEAARIFPDGMTRTAATTLLRGNGFTCTEGGPESGNGAQRLNCHREPHILFCAGHYDVALDFEAGERVRDRAASFYVACL